MQVEVYIEDLYFIGNDVGKTRDIAIILQNIQQKKAVFAAIEKIKNYVNSKGKKYYFRDFLTTKQNEFRKKCQQVADRMMEEDEVDREEVSTNNGKLFIGSKEYVPAVQPPDPTHVLRLPMPKLNRIMALPVQRGKLLQNRGNDFIGYTMPVSTTDEVNDAYMKIRLLHAEARHIVCAYSVPGVNFYQANDHCDDEDYGSSKVILDTMIKNEITNRAVYVVRNCGEKLHSERMQMYSQAAKQVINAHPWNQITNTNQKVAESSETAMDNQPKKWGVVVRGGTRGRRAIRGGGTGHRGGRKERGGRPNEGGRYGDGGREDPPPEENIHSDVRT